MPTYTRPSYVDSSAIMWYDADSDNIKSVDAIIVPPEPGYSVTAFDFTGTDGYIKYSDGLIWQWGYVGAGSTSRTITYPISFPNYVFTVQIQQIRNSANYQNTALNSSYNTSLSSITFIWDNALIGGTWLAVGY